MPCPVAHTSGKQCRRHPPSRLKPKDGCRSLFIRSKLRSEGILVLLNKWANDSSIATICPKWNAPARHGLCRAVSVAVDYWHGSKLCGLLCSAEFFAASGRREDFLSPHTTRIQKQAALLDRMSGYFDACAPEHCSRN